MQRIQEKVRARLQSGAGAGGGASRSTFGLDTALPGSTAIEEVFARAQHVADVGATVPEMSRVHGPMRVVAGGIAKAFLRVAQIITRDQRAFNHALLDLLRTLADQLARLRSETASFRREAPALRREMTETRAALTDVQSKLASLRASLSLQERRLISLLEGSTHPGQRNGKMNNADE